MNKQVGKMKGCIGYMNEQEKSIFFLLLRLGLRTEQINENSLFNLPFLSTDIPFESWKTMSKVGITQGVAAILLDGLQQLSDFRNIQNKTIRPPKAELMHLLTHTMHVEEVCQKHEKVIRKLSAFYAKHNIRMMLLKGYGLSLLYPTPKHRPCGDIDIWLLGEQERADLLINKERGIVVDREHHLHTVFNINGVPIENHYKFVDSESHLSDREIERDLQKIMKNEEALPDYDIANVYYPPINFNALFLLRHAASHFAAAEIAMRHIVDWAMFVKCYHKDVDWEWLERVAKEQNMVQFLHCLNGLCIDYIGVSKEYFPIQIRESKLEDKIMEDILNPQYSDKSALQSNIFINYFFRFRRWWGQRWKNKLVYRENLFVTFFIQIRSHFIKPQSI